MDCCSDFQIGRIFLEIGSLLNRNLVKLMLATFFYPKQLRKQLNLALNLIKTENTFRIEQRNEAKNSNFKKPLNFLF